jgi:ABC-type nitrate/sulfonate/bicarbonate transport system substrate-binding protein
MRGPVHRLLLSLWLVVFVGCDDPAANHGHDAASATPDAASRPQLPVAVGIAIPSYVHSVAWIADARGTFASASLDAEITVTGGSAAAVRTLIAKQSDVVLAGGDAVLKANRAGADLVVVAGFVNRFYHRLVGKTELGSVADLKGKRIGLPFLGGPQDMAVRYVLDKHGLRYDDDVKVLGLGKELNRLAALTRGEIDATTSQTPDAKLRELGLHVLVDPTIDDVAFPYMVLAARRDVLQARRATIAGALSALCHAAAFYRDPANREASLAILAERLSGSDTAGARAARYDSSGPRFLSWPPSASREAFETVGRLTGTPLSDAEWRILDATLLSEVQGRGACKP